MAVASFITSSSVERYGIEMMCTVKVTTRWNVTLCGVVHGFQYFRETCWFHQHGYYPDDREQVCLKCWYMGTGLH